MEWFKSRKANRKSQKLSPLVKRVKKHGGVIIHLKVMGYTTKGDHSGMNVTVVITLLILAFYQGFYF